jgi:hypothetical protein
VDLFGVEQRQRMFRIVTGCDWIREGLMAGEDPHAMAERWQPDLDEFIQLRQKYLLYK